VQEGKIGKLNIARGLCYKRRGSIGPLGNYPISQGRELRPVARTRAVRTADGAATMHYDLAHAVPLWQRRLGNQGIHQMDLCRWVWRRQVEQLVFSYGGRWAMEDAGERPTRR